MILVDTNICIAFLNGSDDSVRSRLTSYSPQELALCSVVKAELLFGARKSAQVERNMQRLHVFFSAFESLPFDDHAAHQYGTIRAQLDAAGTPIGANDLLIAAIALANDAAVATRTVGEFRRVTGLRIENW